MCPLLSRFCSLAAASVQFLFICAFYVFGDDILQPVSDPEHCHCLIWDYAPIFFHSSFFALAEGKSSTSMPCQLVGLFADKYIHFCPSEDQSHSEQKLCWWKYLPTTNAGGGRSNTILLLISWKIFWNFLFPNHFNYTFHDVSSLISPAKKGWYQSLFHCCVYTKCSKLSSNREKKTLLITLKFSERTKRHLQRFADFAVNT